LTKRIAAAERHPPIKGAIWREVARKLKCLGAQSPSAALYKAYEDYQVPLADVLGQLRVPAGGCGAAFAYGGEFLGADLYDRPATLAAYWPRLVRAYTLDALEKPHQPADSVSSLAVGQWPPVGGRRQRPSLPFARAGRGRALARRQRRRRRAGRGCSAGPRRIVPLERIPGRVTVELCSPEKGRDR